MTEKVSGRKGRPLKEKVSITLDEDVVVKIRTLAEDDDRSFSQYINSNSGRLCKPEEHSNAGRVTERRCGASAFDSCMYTESENILGTVRRVFDIGKITQYLKLVKTEEVIIYGVSKL